jgi:hypothetical protein
MKKIILAFGLFFASFQFVAQVSAMYTQSIIIEGNRFSTGEFGLQVSVTDSDQDGVADNHSQYWNTIPTAVWSTPTNWSPGEIYLSTFFLRASGTVDISKLTMSIIDNGTIGKSVKDYIVLKHAWYDKNANGVEDDQESLIPAILERYDDNSNGEATLSEIFKGTGSIPLEYQGQVLPGLFTNDVVGGFSGTGKGLTFEWKLMDNFPLENGGSKINVKIKFDAEQ